MDSKAMITRRKAIGAALVGASPLLFPGRVQADGKSKPHDLFVLLLKGRYKPVAHGHGPNLGLSKVDLNDGSYSATKIYSVLGLPGRHEKKAIGTFYGQLDGKLCAYQMPGGSLSMRFTGQDYVTVRDGQGGKYLEGTFELSILEATGIYRPFVGGHNHMVDKLHLLAPGDGSGGVDEYCFCFISGP